MFYVENGQPNPNNFLESAGILVAWIVVHIALLIWNNQLTKSAGSSKLYRSFLQITFAIGLMAIIGVSAFLPYLYTIGR